MIGRETLSDWPENSPSSVIEAGIDPRAEMVASPQLADTQSGRVAGSPPCPPHRRHPRTASHIPVRVIGGGR